MQQTNIHDIKIDPRNHDILISVNGELVPRALAMVSVFDSGFILGDGVWEGLRLVKGGVLVIEEPDIRTFGVKLIAIAEKLLLMRSHFLAPDAILKLFPSGETQVKTVDGTAWVIIKK